MQPDNQPPAQDTPPQSIVVRRTLWWAELIHSVVFIGGTLTIYWLAGGDGTDLGRPIPEQIGEPARPTVAALLFIAALGVVHLTTEIASRTTEHRAFRAWYLSRYHFPAGPRRGRGRRARFGGAAEAVPGRRQPDMAGGRTIMEALVRSQGPLTWEQMHEMVVAGGPWGPALAITPLTMGKLLRDPSGGPAKWLAPRSHGEPYRHVDTVPAGQGQSTP